MEVHEKLSLAIAESDLRYVTGRVLSVGDHPRSWPFSQWGAMVAFEATKNLGDAHNLRLKLDWEDEIAAAARHGGKFFDGSKNQLDRVVADFRSLTQGTHTAFYPGDRRGRLFDFLRDDFAVFASGHEVVLTNVTGHFMVGIPSDRAMNMESWGPHLHTLATGIGQVTREFVDEDVDELRQHGSHTDEQLTSWDGKLAKIVPSIFGGELETGLAMALTSIHSTAQSAHRWGRAHCCGSCAAASLKHRFVVLHHAVRSLQQLASRPDALGPISEKHLRALLDRAELRTVVEPEFRRLRNGWLHLGLGDIASTLPAEANILTPVLAYTQMEIPVFEELVDRGLAAVSVGIGAWLAEPGADGSALFDHLHEPPL